MSLITSVNCKKTSYLRAWGMKRCRTWCCSLTGHLPGEGWVAVWFVEGKGKGEERWHQRREEKSCKAICSHEPMREETRMDVPSNVSLTLWIGVCIFVLNFHHFFLFFISLLLAFSFSSFTHFVLWKHTSTSLPFTLTSHCDRLSVSALCLHWAAEQHQAGCTSGM